MAEIPDKQIKRLKSLLQDAEINLAAAKELLMSVIGDGSVELTAPKKDSEEPQGKQVEGIYDGQVMLGPDGKNYPVPANYASKSKLLEGDMLKLIIEDDGKMVYKPINPVQRKILIGTVRKNGDQYTVEVSGKEYKLLYASVTFFGLKEGHQVSVSVPADDEEAVWAAVESPL